MSEFIDTLSPPFAVQIYDGSTVLFRRMLGKHWAELTEQIRSERTAENDAEITADASGQNPPGYPDRALARERIRDFIRRTSDIDSLVQYCRSDISGVARLLKYAAVDAGTPAERWTEIADTIPVTSQIRIADEIIFMPILKPQAQDDTKKNDDAGESNNPATTASTGASASSTAESADATPQA